MTARSTLFHRFAIAGACLGLLCGVSSATPNPADYPLRIHIYQISTHEHRHHGLLEYVQGVGHANLYENGMPAAFDFTYRCGDRFMKSEDFETLPARWKKPGFTLVILTHRIGSDSPRTCEFKVDVKNFAYARHNGHVITVPAADLQHWMQVHQYDPEHSDIQPAGIPLVGDAHP
jgi:hypothetical protein